MDEHLELLKKYKFEKQLSKLNKKLKNKTILVYGAGIFFKKIKDNYDLSSLNLIGISDKKFQLNQEGQEEFGLKIVPYDKIWELNPDVILIATLNTFNIYKSLKKELKEKVLKCKLMPLVDKPFFDLLAEVF